MTKDNTMIRVSKDSRDLLKHMSNVQGRTLEWLANDAIEHYCMNYDEIQSVKHKEANEVRNHIVAEGIKLGKLPDRPKDADGNYEYVPDPIVELDTPVVKHSQPGLSITTVPAQAPPATTKTRTCKNGHILPVGRTKCSTLGCKYAA